MKAKRRSSISKGAWFSFCLCLSAEISTDYSELVELSQYSDLACGKRIRKDAVQLINLQDLLNDKVTAVAKAHDDAPDHGLASPIPLLIEKAHVEGNVRRGELLRNAVRESASRGCDLVIVLDIEIVEKVMYRPQLMELKLPVSYILVLFGSQIKNSARDNQHSFEPPDRLFTTTAKRRNLLANCSHPEKDSNNNCTEPKTNKGTNVNQLSLGRWCGKCSGVENQAQ